MSPEQLQGKDADARINAAGLGGMYVSPRARQVPITAAQTHWSAVQDYCFS